MGAGDEVGGGGITFWGGGVDWKKVMSGKVAGSLVGKKLSLKVCVSGTIECPAGVESKLFLILSKVIISV